jgi:MFS family permease
MLTVLNHYLDSVRENLRLDHSSEKEVIRELETHIEDEFQELRESGLSEEEAASTCLNLLGSAKVVARQIYEAHSQGSWTQALLAAMPHLLFGLLFVLNWWRGIGWLLGMLVLVLIMAVYGWWRGKPAWIFPWLGYSLLPVVAAGLLLLYLPAGWAWLAVLFYIPLALWLLYAVMLRTIRKDWLYTSLMLLPVPTIIGWFLAVEPLHDFQENWLQRMQDFAPWIGLTFLALGVTVATFIRVRKRWLRVSVLVVSGLITLTMVVYYTEGRLSILAFLILMVVMLLVLLSPALVERTLGHSG